MGCRRRAFRALPLFLGCVIALAVLSPTASAQAAQAEDPDSLWFTYRAPAETPRVFTTFPPTADSVARAEQGNPAGLASRWAWQLPAAPENWSVPAGTVWTMVLWFSRLDEVVPVGDPILDPTAQGRLRVGVEIAHDGVIAEGFLYVDAINAPSGPTPLSLELTFPAARSFVARDEQETFVLRLVVTGRGTLDATSPATFHYGGADVPSSLHAPGYPVAALAVREAESLRLEECARLLIEQRACDEPLADDDGAPTKSAPAAASPIILVGLLLGLAVIRVSRAARS